MTVLDSGVVAAGASAATFAVDVIRTQTPRSLFDLCLASGREHELLQRRWPGRRWRHPAASLEWEHTPHDRRRLRERVHRLHDWGYPAEWISVPRVRRLEPGLRPPTGEANEIAYYSTGAWYAPAVLARTLLTRARQRRGTSHLNDPVTAMTTAHGRIIEVITAAGRRVSADVVVNCAGPAAADVAALSGVDMPLRQVPGLIVTSTPTPTGLRTIIAAADLNLRPHHQNRVVVHSWTADAELCAGTERHRRHALAHRLLDRASAVPPELATARVLSARVGIRPVPPNGLPIVGFLPHAENLYVVVSHSAVQLAPILGRLAARELTGARQRLLDPFRPTRFYADGKPPDRAHDVVDENTRSMLTQITSATPEGTGHV